VAFLRISGLRKSFGDLVAVDGVSLAVEEGHTLALLGPSGCGKTTILRCLAGLETADAGAIEIAGKPVFDHDAGINLVPEQRELGIVFQSYAVWPHMTVAENVGFPLKVRRVARAEAASRTARVLDMVGLASASGKPATALSGGQQQRVALARALVHEPRLVLFDEPMSNLDARLRAHMRMELAVLQERLGFTAVYVTHDQTEAFSLAETVAVMNHGRIETIGDPRSVFAHPRTPFVAEFLGLNVHHGRALRSHAAPDGGHFVEVALSDAFSLWGVLGGAPPPAAGARVIACTRKEHISVDKPGAASGDPAAAPDTHPPHARRFAGVARAASFLGLEEEYIVAIDGVTFSAIQSPRGLHAGEVVAVTIRPEDCIVFIEDGGHPREVATGDREGRR
jgi:iron(III) transport system ATP-binding protein